MGSQKTCEYNLLNGHLKIIFSATFFLLLASCGITVKSYKTELLSNQKVRVDVKNRTYEAKVTYILKDACESALVKSGANVVDKEEEYLIEIELKEIKAQPVSFSVADIATNYNLEIKGSFKIFTIKDNKKIILAEDDFSPVKGYPVSNSNVELTETKRQLAIMQATYEISESIKDRLVMLQKKP